MPKERKEVIREKKGKTLNVLFILTKEGKSLQKIKGSSKL